MSVLVQAFWLFILHLIADFRLQSDFLARNKAPGSSPVWPWVLGAHAATHAAAVAIVLSPFYGVLEFVAHWLTDYAKSRGFLGREPSAFHLDQALHLGVKGLWLALHANGIDVAF